MSRRTFPKIGLLAATALCGATLIAAPGLARADETSSISSIEKQIRALQGQLNHMKTEAASRDAQVRAARQEAADATRRAREVEDRQALAGYAPGGPRGLAAPPQLPWGSNPHGPYANVNGNPGYYPSGPALKQGQFVLGGVRVTLGGFIEAAGIFRTRNETADISSSFNTGIPYPQSPNYHQPEFRESSRQSRVSMLVEGSPDDHTNLTAFYEADFNSAGTTSNSNESNSYTLRTRHLFAEYARTDWDFYALGGQTWSLATMNKTGMVPRQEDIPLTIDAQYVPGFVWDRNVQLRFVKGFDKDRYAVGVSFESPESSFYANSSTNPAGLGSGNNINYQNAGIGNGGTLNPTANYTTEYVPDIIVKTTADPGYGHYEAFGIARFPHDRVEYYGGGGNYTKLAGGGGGGMILPIIKKKLDFQVSGMIGQGIGRYSSSQIADYTFQRNGAPQPIPEWMALAGVIYRPVKPLDLYAYVGTEQVIHREAFEIKNVGYGYGSPDYSNAGCSIELSSAACTANTSGIVQGTLGTWWRFLKGSYGTMETGLQYSYTRRSIWSGTGPVKNVQVAPQTDENVIMFSFRYLPFQ